MMKTITEMLDHIITSWGTVGHPALLEQFVRRNGQEFKAQPFIGERMKPKECFANAAHYVLGHPVELTYVEGFFWRSEFPLLIHHAWAVDADGNVQDPTVDKPETGQYFGVKLAVKELLAELQRNRVYGVLDTGLGLNQKFCFERDPELKELFDRLTANRYC